MSAGYLVGDTRAGFMRVQLRLTPAAWSTAQQELREFMAGMIERAVRRTNEEVPDGIGDFLEIKGLVIIGPAPEQQEE